MSCIIPRLAAGVATLGTHIQERGNLVRRIATLMICLVSATCDQPPARQPEAVPPPKSHIPVREGKPLLPGIWVVEDTPVLTIGGVSTQDSTWFLRVQDARVLPNGNIAVADMGAGLVYVFDARGTYLRLAGSPGGTETEYGMSIVVDLVDDTLLVYDDIDGRLDHYDQSGRLLRSVVPEKINANTPMFSGAFSDGSWLGISRWSSRDERRDVKSGVRRPPTLLVRYSSLGKPLDTLAAVPGWEQIVLAEGDTVSYIPPPFAKSLEVAVVGNRVVAGTQDSFSLPVFDMNGGELNSIRGPSGSTELFAEASSQALTAWVNSAEGRAWTGRYQRASRLLGKRTLPAHAEIRGAENGDVWVREYTPEMFNVSEAIWRVFDDDGRTVAEIRLPTAWRIHQIGNDFILVSWRAKDGAAAVGKYRIRNAN